MPTRLVWSTMIHMASAHFEKYAKHQNKHYVEGN